MWYSMSQEMDEILIEYFLSVFTVEKFMKASMRCYGGNMDFSKAFDKLPMVDLSGSFDHMGSMVS